MASNAENVSIWWRHYDVTNISKVFSSVDTVNARLPRYTIMINSENVYEHRIYIWIMIHISFRVHLIKYAHVVCGLLSFVVVRYHVNLSISVRVMLSTLGPVIMFWAHSPNILEIQVAVTSKRDLNYATTAVLLLWHVQSDWTIIIAITSN